MAPFLYTRKVHQSTLNITHTYIHDSITGTSFIASWIFLPATSPFLSSNQFFLATAKTQDVYYKITPAALPNFTIRLMACYPGRRERSLRLAGGFNYNRG